MITEKQVAMAIADIIRSEWKPNGHRAEGYSIIVAPPGEEFCVNSTVIERLRLRLNAIDRLVNRDEHRVFVRWTVKSYPPGTEIRFIAKSEVNYFHDMNRLHPSMPHYEVRLRDGALSFAGWLLMLRYSGEVLDASPDDTEHYGSERNMIGDLVDDWSSDFKSLYKDDQELYDYIAWVGCSGARKALNLAVDAYRKYCSDNGLMADAIDKLANQEEEGGEE